MFTLIATIILSVLLSISAIHFWRNDKGNTKDTIEYLTVISTEVKEVNGVKIYKVDDGILSLYGGGVCLSPSMVAVEKSVPEGVLQHELRHAAHRHTVLLKANMIFGFILAAATPMLMYAFGATVVLALIFHTILDHLLRFWIELDADKVNPDARKSLHTHLSETFTRLVQNHKVNKGVKWYASLMLKARLRRLA